LLGTTATVGLDWTEQGLKFHQTHYRSYRGWAFSFLRVK